MVKILGLKSINQWRYANKVDEYLSKISIEELIQTIDNNPDVFDRYSSTLLAYLH